MEKLNNSVGSDEREECKSDDRNLKTIAFKSRNRRLLIKTKARLMPETSSKDEGIGKSKPTVQRFTSSIKSKKVKAGFRNKLGEAQTRTCNIARKNGLETMNCIETAMKSFIEAQNKHYKLKRMVAISEEKNRTLITLLNIQTTLNAEKIEFESRMRRLALGFDPHKTCRLCLKVVDEKESLNSTVNYQPLLFRTKQATDVELKQEEDGWPNNGICEECVADVHMVNNLKQRLQKLIVKN